MVATDNRYEAQIKREADALQEGLRRYRRLRDKQEATGNLLRPLAKEAIDPLSQALTEEQEKLCQIEDKRTIKKHTRPLPLLPADKLALMTVSEIFRALCMPWEADEQVANAPTLTEVSKRLGERCYEERKYDVYRERERTLEGSQLTVVSDLEQREWGKEDIGPAFGQYLIRQCAETTSIVEICRISTGYGKRPDCLLLPKQMADKIESRDQQLQRFAPPIHRPMLVKPRPWTGLTGGGYLTNRELNTHRLVKDRGSKKVRSALKSARDEFGPVFSAVNTLQETGWRINQPVYDVLHKAWETRNLEVLSIVPIDELPKIPDRLPGDPSKDDKRQNSRKRRLAYQARRQGFHDRRQIWRRLQQCKDLLEWGGPSYFPFQLDHRGRVYPLTTLISPQSDDLGRALLEFAEGKPLGDSGEDWLKIQLANTYGLDKESFQDRCRWMDAHEQQILQVAEAPLADTNTAFWQGETVDKPWSFLAACQEWSRYRTEGTNFRSHLPVAVDGTCNGFQHLSAMARDAGLASETNVTPSSKPADLYSTIAEKVQSRVQDDVSRGRKWAQFWSDKVDRSVVKKIVMPLSYGLTKKGARNKLRRLIEDEYDDSNDAYDRAKYLSRVIFKTVNDALPIVQKCLDWLKNVAAEIGEMEAAKQQEKAGQGEEQPEKEKPKPILWSTDSGFRVCLDRPEMREHKLSTKDCRFVWYEPILETVDPTKLRNAFPPSFVHSFDAAHLALTVNRLASSGITDLGTAHDSFAAHACHMNQLADALRVEFVSVHRQPKFQEFISEQRRKYPNDPFEEPPETGDLDIQEALESQYLFC